MAGKEIDERLTELEIQLAHVQRLYEQLNEVVTDQATSADRMQRRVLQLQEQLKTLKEKQQPAIDPLDEKPPHYLSALTSVDGLFPPVRSQPRSVASCITSSSVQKTSTMCPPKRSESEK